MLERFLSRQIISDIYIQVPLSFGLNTKKHVKLHNTGQRTIKQPQPEQFLACTQGWMLSSSNQPEREVIVKYLAHYNRNPRSVLSVKLA